MKRRLLTLSVLVLLAAWPLRADVAPFPSWRLAANGTITRAVQAGSTVYFGGSFTKVGRGLQAFALRLDPATLSPSSLAGCARRNGELLAGPYVDYPSGLTDGDGPFVLPATAMLTRVGADCRLDRRFHVDLPPGVSIADADEVVELGARVYFNAYVSSYPPSRFDVYVVEGDGVTGAITNAWYMGEGSGMRIAGVAGGRIFVKDFITAGGFTLSWFDPILGQVQRVRPLPDEWSLEHVGEVIVTRRYENGRVRLSAFSAATLDPLQQWPAVYEDTTPLPVIASGGGRLFLTGSNVTIDGVAAPGLVAFDATSGARLGGFSTPSWLNDPGNQVWRMATSGSRLLVFGDFASGAPRDQAAALDAATGALDPWTWPYAGAPPTPLAGQLYFSQITAADRVPRQYLAAVDASGAVLPWSVTPAPPSAVTAIALDPATGWLYAAWRGAVRRFAVGNPSAEDAAWGLDVDAAGTPYALALTPNTLYATGDFVSARDRGAATLVAREGGAAVTTGGGLTAWRPMLVGSCLYIPRPPVYRPCISDIVPAAGRIVLHGRVIRLQAPSEPARSLMAVDAATGALDGFLPPVTTAVTGVAPDGAGLLAVAATPAPALVRVDASGAAIVTGLPTLTGLAVHSGRVYVDVERDLASGVPTSNPKTWSDPVGLSDGVVDITDWHGDIAPIAPRAPTSLSASVRGSRVTLQWSPAPGDFAPFAPAPPGGTAAMSHVILASLTPGGPPVATVDTNSPDTTWSIDAPAGTFWLRVAGRNQFGTGAPSGEVAVQVIPGPPERPSDTRAVVSGGVVRIEWQALPRGWPATGYLLDAGTAPGLSNLGTLPVSGMSFQAAVPSGRYYVRVRAVNATGASLPGDEVVVDVP